MFARLYVFINIYIYIYMYIYIYIYMYTPLGQMFWGINLLQVFSRIGIGFMFGVSVESFSRAKFEACLGVV